MLTIMVGAVLAPGLNSIAPALGVSEFAALLITLPALGAILFASFFGKLIDSIGARKTLVLGLWGYLLLGIGGIWVHGPLWVSIDRILLGGFAAGVMASGTAIISHWYHGKARLSVIAKQGMAIELGGVIILFLGGLLSEIDWRAPFLLYGLALVCLVLTAISVPKYVPEIEPVLKNENTQNSDSLRAVLINAVLAMSLFFSMFITLPSHLGDLSYSEAQTGYLLSFISLMAVLSALIMPKIVHMKSEKVTLFLAFLSFAAAHGIFAIAETTSLLVIAAIFAGTGFGFSIPLLNHATVERSSDTNMGRNLAWFAMAVFSGQFLTSALEFLPVADSGVFTVCGVIALACSVYIIKAKE
ncbi:MFS transporter [Alteromonas sp. 1_MG-2023]|nr:MFS transporter [Alteromonas sp. 1_MG-2023]MDO6568805.1 MFS transporter [Alteromonas sp. 1_MG-2023]